MTIAKLRERCLFVSEIGLVYDEDFNEYRNEKGECEYCEKAIGTDRQMELLA